MTKIDRSVAALREAAAALQDLPPEVDELSRGGILGQVLGMGNLTAPMLTAYATKLEEIQIAARAALELKAQES